jgi:DNA-binding winged helix-turn-helix (wHTH) protein/Flp pilus assembly protein TadD
MPGATPSDRFQFGPFELDSSTGELFRDGQSLTLQPQPARILHLLVSRVGELVTREELRQNVWPDGTHVDFDQGLNYCIRQIRSALGESAGAPSYIETLPKRGYRFIESAKTASTNPQQPAPKSRLRFLIPAAALAAALAVFFIYNSAKSSTQQLDLETKNLFLKASAMKDQLSPNGAAQSAKAFEEVIRRAPNYAPAHAGLANPWATFPFLSKSPPTEALNKAASIARHAISLDPNLAEAHAALAHSYFNLWKWREAEKEFQTALRIAPDSATTLQLYAVYLATQARFDEAIQRAESAASLAPTSGLIAHTVTLIHFHAGHFDQAIEAGSRTLDLDRGFSQVRNIMSRAYAMKGKIPEALAANAEWAKFGAGSTGLLWKADIQAVGGNEHEAAKILRQWDEARDKSTPIPLAYAIALLHCNELDRGFEALNQSIQTHATATVWLKATPELRKWQQDPRLLSAIARIDQDNLIASAKPSRQTD